jgi:hypothetical protein
VGPRVAMIRVRGSLAGKGAPTRVAGVRVRGPVTGVSGRIREALPMIGTWDGFARAGRPRPALPFSVLLRSDPP